MAVMAASKACCSIFSNVNEMSSRTVGPDEYCLNSLTEAFVTRETAPCYRYWVGGPDEPVIGGGPEGPEAGGGPPSAGPWLKLTTGTARSPSSAWKNANGLKPSAPAISEVGRVCSEML